MPSLLSRTQIYKIVLCQRDLLMKNLSQHLFIKDLSKCKRQFNTLKVFEICNCTLLISEWQWLKNSLCYFGWFFHLCSALLRRSKLPLPVPSQNRANACTRTLWTIKKRNPMSSEWLNFQAYVHFSTSKSLVRVPLVSVRHH